MHLAWWKKLANAAAMFLGFIAVSGMPTYAQSTLDSIGVPKATTTFPVEHGLVNLNNGYLHLEIPLESHTQRGDLKQSATLTYDSNVWTIANPCGEGCAFWTLSYNYGNRGGGIGNGVSVYGGWRLRPGEGSGAGPANVAVESCKTGNTGNPFTDYTYIKLVYMYSWTDSHGTNHQFPNQTVQVPPGLSSCEWSNGLTTTPHVDTPTSSAYATDGSGYYMSVVNYAQVSIWDTRGALVLSDNLDVGINTSLGNPLAVDRNGNFLPSDGTDTLGRTNFVDTVSQSFNNNPAIEYIDVPVAQGGTARYTITYKDLKVRTSFNSYQQRDRGPTELADEYDGDMFTIDTIQLPDGSFYKFQYESDYGELQSITLPHGGTESFQYINSAGTRSGVNSVPVRQVSSHTGADGTTTFNWVHGYSSPFMEAGQPCEQITNTASNDVSRHVYTFSLCNKFILARSAVHGPANSTVVDASELYSYDESNVCPTSDGLHGCLGVQWRNLIGKTVVVPTSGGQALITDTQYSYSQPSTGIPTTVKQWDYYSGLAPTTLPDSPPGLPTTETDQTLGYSVNGALFPTLVQHKNGNGAVTSSVTYNYDEPGYLAAAPSTVPNHNNSYVNGNRGNLTSIIRCCGLDTSGNYTVSTTTNLWYDDAGTVTKLKDPMRYETTFSYDPTDTFPQIITAPSTVSSSTGAVVTHTIKKGYDPATGQITSITDQNGQITTYAYDTFGRPYTTSFSNGGTPVTLQTTTYPTANETDVVTIQSSGASTTSATIVDSFGRTIHNTVGDVTVDTQYDGQGRVYSVSNPHRSMPSATDGVTTYLYDELGRVNSITSPTLAVTTYGYSSNSVIVTDPLQHKRQFTSDALGELVTVTEPDSSGALTMLTQYQYAGPSRELTQIDQKGGTSDSSQWRTRYFSYDGLGLLTSQTSQEAGTSHYQYDLNGNLTSSQNANSTNNTTSYSYDSNNRVTGKSIQSGPSYSYSYDGQDSSGDSYGIGRLTGVSNGSTVQQTFGHDAMGRIISTSYCLPSDCSFSYKVKAGYDFSDNLTSLTYPDGRTLSWVYDQLGRPTSVNYAQWGATAVNVPYAKNISYAPAGGLQQATFGNGVQLGATYDANQNISSLVYLASGTPITAKSYTWDQSGNNLGSVIDSASGRTQSYSYDQLDRLASMTDSGSTPNACVAGLPSISSSAQTYTPDQWGNLKQNGSFIFNQQIGVKNQITDDQGQYRYDSAGNLQHDGLGNSFSYLSDGHISSSNGVTYTYDGFGQRVRKDGASSKEYIYFGGQLLAMRDPSTGAWTDRIYGPSGAMAHVAGNQSALPIYRVGDHLGSLVNLTNSSGQPTTATAILPFGQTSIDNSGDNFLFTDHERDSENQTDHTLFRQFSFTQGRWISPDPSNGSYDLTDPQSLNRYAYLQNRPTAETDPLGLCGDGDDSDCGTDDGWGSDGGLSFGGWGSSGSGDSWSLGSDGAINVNLYYLSPIATSGNASVDAAPWNGLDFLQLGLNFLGNAPELGVLANGVNAGISLYRGRKGEAALYAGAAVLSLVSPGAGALVKGAEAIAEAKVAAEVTESVVSATEAVEEAEGGVYALRDVENGKVMRTGRTNNLIRREAEHARDPELGDYRFEVRYRTDEYAEQRGLEQHLHDLHNPPLNKIRPISPNNRNIDIYVDAAKKFLQRQGGD